MILLRRGPVGHGCPDRRRRLRRAELVVPTERIDGGVEIPVASVQTTLEFVTNSWNDDWRLQYGSEERNTICTGEVTDDRSVEDDWLGVPAGHSLVEVPCDVDFVSKIGVRSWPVKRRKSSLFEDFLELPARHSR